MKEVEKLMTAIHCPSMTPEVKSNRENEYTIKMDDLYAEPIIPNGSWKTCDDNLEYFFYDEDDTDICMPMDNTKEITNFEKVFINNVPWDRYSELGTKRIEVKLGTGEKFTEYTIVRSLKDFYHRNLTDEELYQIAHKTDDGWGYNKKALKVLKERKNDKNKVLKNYKIMGDRKWFEGLIPSYINDKIIEYNLLLGS